MHARSRSARRAPGPGIGLPVGLTVWQDQRGVRWVGAKSPLCEATIWACLQNCDRAVTRHQAPSPRHLDFTNAFTVCPPLETAGPHSRGLSLSLVGACRGPRGTWRPASMRYAFVKCWEERQGPDEEHQRARVDQGDRSACQKGEDIS